MNVLIAVDIGGTFTDLVALDESTGDLFYAKSLTTPHDLVQGIMDCIGKSGLRITESRDLIHGTTIAINTVIEETGAQTALLTTRGMRDVYAIGRGNRPEAYNLFFRRPKALVPRRLTFEVDERMLASGKPLTPVDEAQVEEIARALAQEKVEAVAVCFLHSYANPQHEQRALEILRRHLPDAYVTVSSRIVREFREYERTSTTAVNAYVGPKVTRYLAALEGRLQEAGFPGSVSLMQSSGGIMSMDVAVTRPVNMMESGPVGGIIAAAEVGRALGYENVVAFDMGGTTAKASLVTEGQPTMAEMYYIGGYASGHPLMIPVVDVVEVGTGGGSIAWLDEIGSLKVGPRSASADPGPISYGRGGTEPTITDANVVLGRIGAEDFLGGEMRLQKEAAEEGLRQKVAGGLGIDALTAAQAVIRIGVYNMSLAVRQVSVERGFDPREFTMVASGGAGPLHAALIARELHIPRVVIPRFPAHFSAMGMLMTDHRLDFVRTYIRALDEIDFGEVAAIYDEMTREAVQTYQSPEKLSYQLLLDMRYVGQEFTLSVPVTREQVQGGLWREIRGRFDEVHERRYGHTAADEQVEVVNVRLTAIQERRKPVFPRIEGTQAQAARRTVYFDDLSEPVDCAVYERESLPPGFTVQGPALVHEYGTTTVVFAGDSCTVAPSGELVISVGGGAQ